MLHLQYILFLKEILTQLNSGLLKSITQPPLKLQTTVFYAPCSQCYGNNPDYTINLNEM